MKQPAYGTERVLYVNQQVRREVFAQTGRTTFWDEDETDWHTWLGSWVLIEVLGTFSTSEEAREFMAARKVPA